MYSDLSYTINVTLINFLFGFTNFTNYFLDIFGLAAFFFADFFASC